MNKKGFIISLEGIDGCGKTTISRELEKQLNNMGYKTMLTREPGGVEVAEKIREIILNDNIDGITEALLFASARRIHLIEKVIPAIKDGCIVIMDRYIDSSLAYQGIGRGLGLYKVLEINNFVVENHMPKITFFLDISPEIAINRIKKREKNRLDKEKINFYNKVKEGFELLNLKFNERIKRIDVNNKRVDEILNECISILKQNQLI